jgi:hypothetical protein
MNTHPHTTAVTCLLCRNLVSLENAKADELGRAVHEDCYVRALTFKSPAPGGSTPNTDV